MCVEVLTRALCKVICRRKCEICVKISPRASKISCLFFVDDILPFWRINLESYRELSSVLSNFCRDFSQLINFHKSPLTFPSNVSAYDNQIAPFILNITHQYNLEKCLRCLVFKGKPKTKTVVELVNRTTKELQSLKTRHVSKARKVMLIQANIESNPSHTI